VNLRTAAARAAAALIVSAHLAASQDTGRQLAAADAAMQAGEFAQAAEHYHTWLQSHPDSPQVLYALGVCYVQLGRSSEAVPVLRRYLRTAPDDAQGHALLGIALLDGASSAEARASLERSLALDRQQPDAVQALARIHLIDGEPAKAVALLRPLVDAVPATASRPLAKAGVASVQEIRALYAEALIRSGDSPTAATVLEAELAARKDSPVQTYVLAGWAQVKSGNPQRAAEICEQGMRLYPDSEIEGVYLSLGGPLLAQRTAARLEQLKTTNDPGEMIALGRVLTDVDRTRQTRAHEIARSLLERAIAIVPANPSAHYNYGRLLRRDDIRGALAAWEKALTLAPQDVLRMQIQTQIGRAKDELSDLSGAEAAFKDALEINRRLQSRVPEPALEYVRFLQLHTHAADAEALLNEVLGWNPWAPEAHVERARLYADAGKWDVVVEEGEFVLRNAEENGDLIRVAHLLLANAYYRLRQPEKAQVHRAWIEAH
jgi:tetratricopeptide (TPR) repeat protein